MAPPSQDRIESLEQVLRIKTAYNHFWNYLEQMEQHGQSDLDTNNFRLLALYTDIRLYDTEIREAAKKASLKRNRRDVTQS